jgi:hypothetical protein
MRVARGAGSTKIISLNYGCPSIRLPRLSTLKRGFPLFAVGVFSREHTAGNFEFSMFVAVKAVSVPRLIEGSSFRSAYWTCGHAQPRAAGALAYDKAPRRAVRGSEQRAGAWPPTDCQPAAGDRPDDSTHRPLRLYAGLFSTRVLGIVIATAIR